MDGDQIRALIDRLRALEAESREVEHLLASLGLQPGSLLSPGQINDLAERLDTLAEQEALQSAEARLDFEDDYYRFIRAIDGDTIVVEPPRQLLRWMKNVHVRLYGLETPELWEDLGPEYQRCLEELCLVDANRRLMIVWERERLGTNYEGYPLSTFDRGVGHVFLNGGNGRYYYVNALMHLLKYSSLEREGKSLLRGRRIIEALPLSLAYHGPCATTIEPPTNEPSATFQRISAMRPPVCLLTYPRLPSLDPRREDFGALIMGAIRRGWQTGCPFQECLLHHSEAIVPQIAAQSASPFDLPLAEISMWAASRYDPTA